MKIKTHSVYIRMMSLLLAVLCIVGLFPASALAASPNTIKLEDCTYNGVHYDSPALGICYMHQMQFDFNGDSVMGFCSEKGKGMGWSLEGHEWNSPKEINDSTVKIMMAYFYCHTKGIFTDRAQALGLDEVWGSDYTWTMNAYAVLLRNRIFYFFSHREIIASKSPRFSSQSRWNLDWIPSCIPVASQPIIKPKHIHFK